MKIFVKILNGLFLMLVVTQTGLSQHNAHLDIEGVDTANICLKTPLYNDPTILEFASGDTAVSHTHYYLRNQNDQFRIDVRSDLIGGGLNFKDGKRDNPTTKNQKNIYAPQRTDILRLNFDGDMSLSGSIQLNSDPLSTAPNGSIRYNVTNDRIEGYVNGGWKSICPACPNLHVRSPEGNQTFSQDFSINGSNQVVITVEFSAPVNPASVVIGSTFILTSASSTTALGGTFTWNYNHTRLVFTTTSPYTSFCTFTPDCFFDLEMTGGIISKTGCSLDGDGDGEEGGSFITEFGILG